MNTATARRGGYCDRISRREGSRLVRHSPTLCSRFHTPGGVMQRHTRITLAVAGVLSAGLAAAQPPKHFMGGPVTIEDQGSFFVGGVTKVSEYAAVPFAPPGQTP